MMKGEGENIRVRIFNSKAFPNKTADGDECKREYCFQNFHIS